MALWGNIDRANNAPKWKSIATGSSIPHRGGNVGGYANNLWSNVTTGAFINGVSTGVFGISQLTGGNEAGALAPRMISPGWVYTTQGTGPVTGVSVFGGTGFVNGATITLSNGTANATAVVVTNGGGNLSSTTIRTPGFGFVAPQAGPGTITTTLTSNQITGVGTNFVAGLVGYQVYTSNNAYVGTITAVGSTTSANISANASVALTSNAYRISVVTSAFNREKSAVGVANATGGSAFNAAAIVGYTNGNILTISNSVINATATIATNTSGGTLTFTFINNGVFANTLANNQVVFSIANSTGGSGGVGNSSVGIFAAANLAASTGGSINDITLGGRAGRVNRETLAYVRNMANNATSGGGSTTP